MIRPWCLPDDDGNWSLEEECEADQDIPEV